LSSRLTLFGSKQRKAADSGISVSNCLYSLPFPILICSPLAAYFSEATMGKLNTVVDFPLIRELNIPSGIFLKRTRPSKKQARTTDPVRPSRDGGHLGYHQSRQVAYPNENESQQFSSNAYHRSPIALPNQIASFSHSNPDDLAHDETVSSMVSPIDYSCRASTSIRSSSTYIYSPPYSLQTGSTLSPQFSQLGHPALNLGEVQHRSLSYRTIIPGNNIARPKWADGYVPIVATYGRLGT